MQVEGHNMMRCIKFAHIDQLNGLGSNQVCWYIDGQRLFVSALNALVVSTRTEQCLNIRFNYAYGFVRSDRHFALSAKISWMLMLIDQKHGQTIICKWNGTHPQTCTQEASSTTVYNPVTIYSFRNIYTDEEKSPCIHPSIHPFTHPL